MTVVKGRQSQVTGAKDKRRNVHNSTQMYTHTHGKSMMTAKLSTEQSNDAKFTFLAVPRRDHPRKA